jgi:hypothetical protein
MPDQVLERRLWLPRPRPEVFALVADPRNLERLLPPWAAPVWLGPLPAGRAAGAVLDFRLRRPLPGRWRVMVREYDPPYRFVDVQLRGPFARWEHRLRFLEGPAAAGGAGPPGTWIEDRLTYRPALGPLGGLLHALGGRRALVRLFDHRDARLRELLGG